MNNIQVFNSEQFGQIRTTTINGEPWFVAADVCKALDINDASRAMARLDDDEGGRIEIAHPQNQQKTITVNAVNESGLYELVLGSRKKEAKAFKRWIKREVLPSIRKTGGYIMGEENMTDDEIMASALIVANRKLEERAARIKSLENKIALDAPKVEFHDMVADATNCIYVSELAKLLHQNGFKIGRDGLFELLRKEGYLLVTSGQWNKPSQYAMNLGLFKVVERIVDKNGYRNIQSTTFVTPKGIKYFMKRYIVDGKAGQPIMISAAMN